ncbi:MAG: hypothetical protein AB1630_12245 [bacterium]
MKTYRFETEILPDGMIFLPKEFDGLKSHRVEIIIVERNIPKEDKGLFWDSFGGWKDKRSAEEIIKEIYETRRSSTKEINL